MARALGPHSDVSGDDPIGGAGGAQAVFEALEVMFNPDGGALQGDRGRVVVKAVLLAAKGERLRFKLDAERAEDGCVSLPFIGGLRHPDPLGVASIEGVKGRPVGLNLPGEREPFGEHAPVLEHFVPHPVVAREIVGGVR